MGMEIALDHSPMQEEIVDKVRLIVFGSTEKLFTARVGVQNA